MHVLRVTREKIEIDGKIMENFHDILAKYENFCEEVSRQKALSQAEVVDSGRTRKSWMEGCKDGVTLANLHNSPAA